MSHAHDLHYFEKERPYEEALRATACEAAAMVAPDVMPERPDVEDVHAKRLRKFAAWLSDVKRLAQARMDGEGSWRTQIEDSEELKDFAAEVSAALEAMIFRVLAAADAHERLASVFVQHEGGK